VAEYQSTLKLRVDWECHLWHGVFVYRAVALIVPHHLCEFFTSFVFVARVPLAVGDGQRGICFFRCGHVEEGESWSKMGGPHS
jgi:hypothetical protein